MFIPFKSWSGAAWHWHAFRKMTGKIFSLEKDLVRKVIFGWQAALLCPSLAFWWDKKGSVWSKLCFILIRVEEED